MERDDRLPKLMLLGLIALSLLSIHPGGTADPGDGPLPPDHIRVSMWGGGEVRVEGPAGFSRRVAETDLLGLQDALREAVPPEDRPFFPAGDPTVLEVVAPADRPWVDVGLLSMFAADARIPTVLLRPRGLAPLRVPVIIESRGFPAFTIAVSDVVLRSDAVELLRGELAFSGHQLLPRFTGDDQAGLRVVTRASLDDPALHEGLRAALEVARDETGRAGRHEFGIAVTWTDDTPATFAEVVELMRLALSFEPREFYFLPRGL